jgi:hypothetical protein
MQPLKPEERKNIRQEHPQAAPGDLERYEQLLSQRFAIDPDRPQSAPERAEESLADTESASAQSIEAELRELHQRLFAKKGRSVFESANDPLTR